MDERKILAAALKSRKSWEVINEVVSTSDLSPEASVVWALASEFYSADPASSVCDADILISRAQRSLTSNKTADVVVAAIRDLVSIDVSGVNVAKELVAVQQSSLGNKIASALAAGRHTPNIKELMNEYQRLGEVDGLLAGTADSSDDEEFVGVRVSDLLSRSFQSDGLIQLYPKLLNDQIDGGVRGGHHILIFAPTEMGKSLIALNMCYGFLRQDKKVLYVGNEDPAADMMMRMMTRLTGMNQYEIMAEPEKADGLLGKRNWDKFTFASLAPGSFPKVHKLIDKYAPHVLVLDQLRNLDVQTENRTQALERAATEARNTAKRYDIPVVSVTQAGDSASGKTVLNRGDVDGSNVGIPGQVDLMIGVGATPDMEERNMRMLSFPKNKLSGRHTPIQIQIDPFLSRVVE